MPIVTNSRSLLIIKMKAAWTKVLAAFLRFKESVMADQLSKSGLSDDINNGRHRLVRETIKGILDAIMHQGLSDEDRSYIVDHIATATQVLSIPSFRDTIEKKDEQIIDLKAGLKVITAERDVLLANLEASDRERSSLKLVLSEINAELDSFKNELVAAQESAKRVAEQNILSDMALLEKEAVDHEG